MRKGSKTEEINRERLLISKKIISLVKERPVLEAIIVLDCIIHSFADSAGLTLEDLDALRKKVREEVR